MTRPGSMKDLLGDTPYVLPTPPAEKAFDGPEYEPGRDAVRLGAQIKRVFDAMKDGQWRTLERIGEITGDPVASVSAQLRHLRKEKYGSHDVKRRHAGGGLFEYQLTVNEERTR